MTLQDAVRFALTHHPRVRSADAETEVARAHLDEARLDELPSAGVSAQLNRSTGNTVPGAFFASPGFAPIAGPVRGRSFDAGSWQTGASLWASWNVVALVREAAVLDAALASRREAEAAAQARRLEVAYAAADSFIALAAAEAAVDAAQANVERARVLDKIVETLVQQQLRPGLDATRAQAELAFAQTQLARAEQGRELRRAQLAQALALPPGTRIEVAANALLATPEAAWVHPARPAAEQPLLREADAQVERSSQVRRSAELEYLPRVELVAALWARGSGLYESSGAGLLPDIPNWAAGVVLTWPLLDLPKARARTRAAAAEEASAAANRDDVELAVRGQLSAASALLHGATRIAQTTPAALTSASAAQTQASARYEAGLASILDVADAQRARAQAELDDALARLEVRRAELLLARAAGDLTPFLQRVQNSRSEAP